MAASNARPLQTPILEREEPLPKPSKGILLWAGLGIILGATVGAFAVLHSERYWFNDLNSFLPVVALFPLAAFYGSLFCAVLAHEIGHLSIGLLLRFRLLKFVTFPVEIVRTHTGLALRRARFFGYLGMVQMLPTHASRVRWQWALFCAGGPTANLAMWLVAEAMLSNAQPSYSANFLSMLSIWSLWLGVFNLIPFNSGSFQSDGGHILMSIRGGASFNRYLALLGLVEESVRGTPPRDLNPQLIAQALQPHDGSQAEARALLAAYSRACDLEEIVEAAIHLERTLKIAASLGSIPRKCLMREAILFQAWYMGNYGKAMAWQQQAGKPPRGLNAFILSRPEIALLWVSGDRHAALAKLEETLVAVHKMPHNYERDQIGRSLAKWREKMTALISVPR